MVSLFIALLLCVRTSHAQQKQIDFSELEKTISEEMQANSTPGAAVAIIVGGQLVFAQAFGVSNVETRTPATPGMLFRIASNTKMLTAAALVTLAEQGKLRLDEPVGTYVKGLSPKLSKITVHQLLGHTSGMQDGASDFGSHDDAALGQTVRAWNDAYLFTEPGVIFSYSNLGYDLAGLTLEAVTGKPYADAMNELLFKPLGMQSTTLRPTIAMTYPLSQGHKLGEDGRPVVVRPYSDKVEHWPSGGVFTSILDYSRFVIAFMNQGKVDGQQILLPGMIAKLSTPHVESPSGNQQWRARVGYGLNILDYRGVRVLQHGGNVVGFGSLLRMSPEHRFAVIILANRSGALLLKSFEKATELAVSLPPATKPPAKGSLPVSAEEMNRYAGIYVNSPDYLSVEILKKDNSLFLRQVGSSASSKIIRIGENRFSADGEEFVLIPGANGTVVYLHIVGHAFKKAVAQR
ncbi:MAG TPA: serine hydrolase domain-containing protein [Pyrinomonadaceae bacterium]|jgi:CubicO group peptidase (beta-lactamase class C family)|nr:serine hydrolase domain-containing protein [Pyrinomonadaceae bacterium]